MTDDIDLGDDIGVVELDTTLDDTPEPELLPQGMYPAELVNCEARHDSKGVARYNFRFVISPDDFPPDYDVNNYPDGKSLYWGLMKVPTRNDNRSILALRRFMQTLDVPTDVTKVNPSEWIGRRVLLKVEHDTYEGNTRESIARNGIQRIDS